ncbi:hypothetical protein ACFWZ2_08595 [Streptomyces sp. NPDC059002]|uniref:hypothetical protein n=1 Tax=Streptomyces sp. NPDC059002 TaxID=3346690 RepID=UPI0036AE821D
MKLRTLLTSSTALAALLTGLVAGPSAAAEPSAASGRATTPPDNTLCIYSTETTDKTTGGYVWDVGTRAYDVWNSKDFRDKYGQLSYAEQTNKLLYELNVSQHVFGHSWLVHFNSHGAFQRKLATGDTARYDTYSFQPQDPDGRNGDGSPVDGMSINYTGYDINTPGKPLVEWDRPSRKQDREGAYAPRAAHCKTLTATQQSAFEREIERRKQADEKYTLLPSWNYLLTGGWTGTPARNCTTFALQVWDTTMASAPSERIDPKTQLPAAELERHGAKVPADLTQSEFSAWIPALAGKWIYEKNGNRHENPEVPRFSDDLTHPTPARDGALAPGSPGIGDSPASRPAGLRVDSP